MIKYKKTFKTVPQRVITHILTAALILSPMELQTNAVNITLNSNAFAEANAFGNNTPYGLDIGQNCTKDLFW